MKKTALALILLCLMDLGLVCFQPIRAESQDHLTINSDGTITPSTPLIQKIGDVYLLTNNITQELWVYRSNAIFDGNGHTMSGARLLLLGVSNVTVRNITITNSIQGISLADSSDVIVTNNIVTETGSLLPFSETWAISVQRGDSIQIIENNIVGNMIGFSLAETSNNLIAGNNITDCSSFAFGLYNSSDNRIFHNNLVNNSVQFYDWGVGLYPYMVSRNTWDNGSVSGGNYWSDYELKYPASSEINQGVWNTSYVLDANNIDNYPLVEPFIAPSSPEPKQTESFPTTLLFVASVGIAIVVIVLFVYFKKAHRDKSP